MGTDRLIYIRTDGNSEIASGHLVRCVSIAHACVQQGMKVCFLVSDEQSEALLGSLTDRQAVFPLIQLSTAVFDSLEEELPEVLSLLKQNKNTHVIYLIDSYYVTKNYLSTLNPLAKTVYLDDLQLFDYPVHLLVNYDVISPAQMPAYQAAYQNAGQLLLGAAYTPLRPQFQCASVPVRKDVSDILISTGGTDPFHFTLTLINQILFSSDPTLINSFRNLRFHIVIGKLNTDKEALYRIGKEHPHIKLYENLTNIASLMKDCDLAVSAAGTTLYELCALGIPSVSFSFADNQLISAQAFDEAKAIPYAGDLRTALSETLRSIIRFIYNNACSSPSSYNERKTAHTIMNSLVDGKGAQRIAEALKNL